jgi:hypothetical protein
MNQTPSKLIFIVVCSIAILAAIGMCSICASLFLHVYADAAIVTAVLTLTSGLVGALTGLLINTRTQQPQEGTASSTTSTTTIVPVPPLAAPDQSPPNPKP